MEFKTNTPYEVSGSDLQKFLNENDCRYQGTYNVDPEASYNVLVWLDAEKYENKVKMVESFKKGVHKNRPSAHLHINNSFYIMMYTPISKENLPEPPKYDKDMVVDEKSGKPVTVKPKKELPWEAERREKAQKVLDILTEPLDTRAIAKKSGFSYTSTLKIMKFLLGQKKVVRKAPAGWKFGESRPQLQYHKVQAEF